MSIPSANSVIQIRLERDAGDTALAIIRQEAAPAPQGFLPLSTTGAAMLWELECLRQAERLMGIVPEEVSAFRLFGAASPFSGGCRFQTVDQPAEGVRMSVARLGHGYLAITTMRAELPEAAEWLDLLGYCDEFFFERSRAGRVDIHSHGD